MFGKSQVLLGIPFSLFALASVAYAVPEVMEAEVREPGYLHGGLPVPLEVHVRVSARVSRCESLHRAARGRLAEG